MVSVIMPAYNVGAVIGGSIQSVLDQDYRELELIVIDDGSTDDTASVVQKLAQKDGRIRLLRQENGGVSAARNAGLAAAKGDFISFLDGDDLWEKDTLSRLMARQEETGADFVYGRTEEVFSDGRRARIGDGATEGCVEDFIHRGMELRLPFHISAMLVRAEVVRREGLCFPLGVPISEDTCFFIELLCVARATSLDEVVSHYIRRDGSATDARAWDPKDWTWQADIYDLVRPFVEAHRPEAVEALSCVQAYLHYRFILRTLRHGFLQEAQETIVKRRERLRSFSEGKGKWSDRMKCRAFLALSGHPHILKAIASL